MQAPITTFRAMGDPTRMQILSLLGAQPMTIGEVSSHFDMTRAGVKKHLRLLEDGNLIEVKARGRERINSLNKDGFQAVSDWIVYFDQFWDERLAKLKSIVEENKK